MLWENFLIAERIKYLKYHKIYVNTYFWRTVQQPEIDWIEEHGGKIYAFEFKWKADAKQKIPKKFIAAYDAEPKVINTENYYGFLS